MEEEKHASSGDVEVKLSENKIDVVEKEASKEDYDAVLDGEFIKVEKEVGDAKENSQSHRSIEVEEIQNNEATSINLLEAGEKIKSLEIQLEKVTKELHDSESEKALLKSEADSANKKLDTISKHGEELELDNNRMKEEISAAEQKYSMQVASLEEALGTLDVKQKELRDLKDSFHGASAELENSRKKLEGLEAELALSASEARKLEELSNERSSHADIQSKRASELEKMLELAKCSAKDMEDQIGNLQEELKGLYTKVSEHMQVEEALNRSTLELSAVQEKLKLSESQVLELERKFASKEDIIKELTQELDVHKSSQERMKEEFLGLEDMLSSSRDEIQSKIINLEEAELKLQQEIKSREDVEASLRNQGMQMLSLQDEFKKLTGEKEDLLSTVADLNTNLSLTKELCGQLEDKFLVADQNFNKTDSLLSQARSYNAELEERLKSLEELHGESRMVAETASQRNLELEGLIQSSSAAEEGLKEQLREKEVKLISAEQKNVEFEEQMALAELKFTGAESEIKLLTEKILELTVKSSNLEEERELLKGQIQQDKEKISQLESSLSEADSRSSKLEQEVKDLAEVRDAHEGRAAAAHQRLAFSMSQSQTSRRCWKNGEELELLLENARQLNENLEQLASDAEAKYRDAEAESKQYSSRVSELSTELEAYKTKSESLEIIVQETNEKERQLTDMLNKITEEKNELEELSNISSEKLSQAEKFIEELQNEMKSARGNLESIEEELKASGIRENEILMKLKSAEEQLEHHGRTAEQASTRCLELESNHESFRNESELKLQEAISGLTLKDSEAKQLKEKVTFLEEEVIIHQREAVEAAEKVASLEAELEASAARFFALENTVEELKEKFSDSETNLEQSYSENELLAGTNSQLRSELEVHQAKVNELNELLSSIHAEKEATAEKLASHIKTIEELTNEHSRGLELNSATELRFRETELQLHEAIEKFTQRDSEATTLNEKLLARESQLRRHEEQLAEVNTFAENKNVELEEALLKMQNLKTTIEEMQGRAHQFETENEGLARANMLQTEQLATYETKVNELETSLHAAVADKEDALLQLKSSKKTIEDLTQQLASDGDKLQSQIFSVMEENNTLNTMYQNAKEELQSVTVRLEEQKAREISLNSELDSLKSEIARMRTAASEEEAAISSKLEEHSNILCERDGLNEKLKLLREELTLAHNSIAEQKESESRMVLERDAVREQTLGEMEAEHQRAVLLEKQVEELKQKLQLAETQYNEKVAEESKKVDLLNVELIDLKHKLSQNVELEKKIADLQNKLENAKSSKQPKDATIEGSSNAGTEVRSRELPFDNLSAPTPKRNKGNEGVHRSTADVTPLSPPSGIMAFKFILGVALVSVVIGIILGKKY
ncbi:myosin-2 heavy chain-like isoform X2 [Asparagus officinalis]|uniref:myosin-2 heavy chain-like isoform X2 n=1 Tax=Asparagus officinalis TaxID=4686 RepID=UPI00098E3E70|nr:myosin-2 heavy chain-like isoform X2 [Asparagus officinalis]